MSLSSALGDLSRQSDLDMVDSAYRRALQCVTYNGDAEDDPHLHKNMANHIIAVVGSAQKLNFLLLTNRAIARYQAQRASEKSARRTMCA
jgi:hypothetical protein